jgi:hypothetical protein
MRKGNIYKVRYNHLGDNLAEEFYFQDWETVLECLQEKSERNLGMVKLILENEESSFIALLSDFAFEKIAESIIEDLHNWDVEDVKEFFCGYINISERKKHKGIDILIRV